MKKTETTKKDENIIEKPVLHGILEEFRTDLEKEIKSLNNSKILLECGRIMPKIDENFRYQFSIEYIPNIPSDSPCKLTVAKEDYDVSVVSVDGTHIIISSAVELPPALGKVYLESGTTILLECLIKCIEENAETSNPAADRLIPLRTDNGNIVNSFNRLFSANFDDNYKGFNYRQIKAVESAINNDITYIWGPPGTGKTQVIGAIVEELMSNNRSVLLLSHTNTAVDGAIKRVCDNIEGQDYSSWPVLRLGSPSGNPVIPDKCLIESHKAEQGKEYQEQLDDAMAAVSRVNEQLIETEKGIICHKWISNSQIGNIHNAIEELDTYTNRSSELKKKRSECSEKIAQIGQDPEITAYYKDIEYSNTLLSDKKKLSDLIGLFNEDKERFESDAKNITEQLAKHQKCEGLFNQLSKYSSKQELQHAISEANYESFRLRKINEELENKIVNYKRIIDEHNRKGALRRLISLNLEDVDEAEEQVPILQDEYNRNEKRISVINAESDEKNRELSIIQTIEIQIQSLNISNTKQYWEEACHDVVDKIENVERLISEKQEEIFELINKKKVLDESIEERGKKYSYISDIQAEYNAADLEIEKISEEEFKVQSKLNELIWDELKLVGALFVVNTKEPRECYEILRREYDSCADIVDGTTIDQLTEEKEKLQNEKKELNKQIAVLEEKLNALEREVILSRPVIGTTLTKAYIHAVLRERKFDTVIVDEVSMALIPALWCACLLANKNIVVVGDFLQLSPISQIKYDDLENKENIKEKWLKEDIFKRNRIDISLEINNLPTKPDNIVMLDHQYRMEKEIADIANELYYENYGGLKSDDSDVGRVKAREDFINWYGNENTVNKHIYMVDTENLNAWVNSIPMGHGHTRVNLFSASLDVSLAFNLIDPVIKKTYDGENIENKTYVLIIVPYKAHVDKLKQIIKLEYERRGLSPDDFNFIKAGTIHSFQGQEADIVIFDFVVDEPHIWSNLFLPDEKNGEDLKRMFNVAITRARFKLYFVGNFNFLRKRAQGTQLKHLLTLLDKYPRIDAAKSFPKLKATMPSAISVGNVDFNKIIIATGVEALPLIKEDISNAKYKVVIYTAFLSENRVGDMLPFVSDAIKRDVKVAMITKPLSERKKNEYASYKKCEDILKKHGVSIIHKKGMHEKVIGVDDEIVWLGSLNAMSFTGNTVEIMTRYVSREFTEKMLQVVGYEEVYDSTVNTFKKTCPICGSEMIYGESDRGGYYWKCVEDSYSYSFGDPYPLDGLMRCKKPECCGEYKFVMKNEPRWVCTENSKHFQKFKYVDLKLPKMKEKLTEEELQKVNDLMDSKREKNNKVK